MKTKRLILLQDCIKTDSLRVRWHQKCQMECYEERKGGEVHGDYKFWHSDGRLWWHSIYENGILVKRIV